MGIQSDCSSCGSGCSSCRSTSSDTTENQVKYENVRSFYDERVVLRFMKKLDLSRQEAEILFDDVRRYLYLCSVSSISLSPTPKIDKGWHEFLLFTRAYAEFCTTYLTKFIHHEPFTASDENDPNWFSNLRATFEQQFPNEHMSDNWQTDEEAQCSPVQESETSCRSCGTGPS